MKQAPSSLIEASSSFESKSQLSFNEAAAVNDSPGDSLSSSGDAHSALHHSKAQIRRSRTFLLNSIYLNEFDSGETSKTHKRQNRKRCMIYPEDPWKQKWDLFTTLYDKNIS